MPSLFDSLCALTLVTIGYESSNSVYFSSFFGKPSPQKFPLSKAVLQLTAKVLKILSLSTETAMPYSFLTMVFASLNSKSYIHAQKAV